MPKLNLDAANVATILVLLYALVGGALVVLSAVTHVDPQIRLGFADYLQQMAVATGALAIGRGIAARRK